MKIIDKLADQNNGHYVMPKSPFKNSDEATRKFIAMLKEKNNAHKVK